MGTQFPSNKHKTVPSGKLEEDNSPTSFADELLKACGGGGGSVSVEHEKNSEMQSIAAMGVRREVRVFIFVFSIM